MNITAKRTSTILEYLTEKHYLETCSNYGEIGYDTPEAEILFCDWNDVPTITQEYLEGAGFVLEWSDEWILDNENDKAYRTVPNSYGWVQLWRITDGGELLTPDDDVQNWIEYAEITDHSQSIVALPYFIDLTETDYTRVDCNYENGLHKGQDDDPALLARHFLGLGDVESIIFQINRTGQFDAHFSVWIKYIN